MLVASQCLGSSLPAKGHTYVVSYDCCSPPGRCTQIVANVHTIKVTVQCTLYNAVYTVLGGLENTHVHTDKRQCLNELQKEYCLKTKIIALD